MIKITADSTCDLSKEILYEMDITLTPLVVMIGEKAYHDGVDIVPADIFRYVECDNIPCKTCARRHRTSSCRAAEKALTNRVTDCGADLV